MQGIFDDKILQFGLRFIAAQEAFDQGRKSPSRWEQEVEKKIVGISARMGNDPVRLSAARASSVLEAEEVSSSPIKLHS